MQFFSSLRGINSKWIYIENSAKLFDFYKKKRLKINIPDLECLIYKIMGKMRKLLFLVQRTF